jgi:hypothetical protein
MAEYQTSAYVALIQVSSAFITARWEGLDNNYSSSGRQIDFQYRASGGSWSSSNRISLQAYRSYSDNFTINSLLPSTTYEIRSYIIFPNGDTTVYKYANATTAAITTTAIISLVSVNHNSLTVQLTNLDSSYNGGYGSRTVEWGISNLPAGIGTINWMGSSYLSNGVTSGAQYLFSNLTANTQYFIFARIRFTNYAGIVNVNSQSFITGSPPRPARFNWTYKINGYGEKLSGTYPINDYVAAAEWNALRTNVNTVREYRGYSSYYWSYTVNKGTIFTAAIYNEVVRAIKGISGYGTSLYEVSKGNTITSGHLNTLMREINNVP